MKIRIRTLFLLLSLGLVVAALGFYYWTTSSHYALYELQESIRNRDAATFHSRVDMDRLIDSLIDSIASRERRHAAGDDWVDLRERLQAELAKLSKDAIRGQIKSDIDVLFNRGRLESLNGESMGRLLPIRKFVQRVSALSFGKLSSGSRTAHAMLILELGFMKRSYPLVLQLENEDRWRVSGIDGLATVLDLFERDAGLFVEQKNKETVEDFTRRIKVRMVGIRKDQSWIIRRNLHLSVGLRNASARSLKNLDGFLVLAEGGKELARYPFRLKDSEVKAGEEKTYGMDVPVGLFDEAAQNAFTSEKLIMNFIFARAAFGDGSELRLLKNWEEWPLDADRLSAP